MLKTFNCGIGMALVVGAGEVEPITEALSAAGETVSVIGRITADGPGVRVAGAEQWRSSSSAS